MYAALNIRTTWINSNFQIKVFLPELVLIDQIAGPHVLAPN